MRDHVPLSVVVPNARAFPARLVRAVANQGQHDEIIVVRNRPERGWDRWAGLGQDIGCTAQDPAVVLASGAGAATARNVGWSAAAHPWVLFLDDDIALAPGVLDAVRAEVRRYPEPGVVTLRVVSRPGCWSALVQATIALDRGPEVRTTAGAWLALPETWRFGVGAVLVAHRDVLVATGGFKNQLGAGRRHGGAEDLEFLWHASRHATVRYRGDIAVEHADADRIADVAGKFRQYGRALGRLAGTAKGWEGAATAWGYGVHLGRATLGPGGLSQLTRRDRAALRVASLWALAETTRVYLVSLLRNPRSELLCTGCRPG